MDNYNWLLIIGIIFQLMLDFILIVSLLSPSENFFTKDDDNSSIQVKLAFILIVVSLLSLIIRYQRGESRRSSDEKLLQNPSIDSSENGGVPFSTEQESDGYHTKDDGRIKHEGRKPESGLPRGTECVTPQRQKYESVYINSRPHLEYSLGTDDNASVFCVPPVLFTVSPGLEKIQDVATNESPETVVPRDRMKHDDGPPESSNVDLSNRVVAGTDASYDNKDSSTVLTQNPSQNELRDNNRKVLLDNKVDDLERVKPIPHPENETEKKPLPDEQPVATVPLDTGQQNTDQDGTRIKVFQDPFEVTVRKPYFNVSDLNLEGRKFFTGDGNIDRTKIFDHMDAVGSFLHPEALKVPLTLVQTWAIREEHICRLCCIYPHDSVCVQCGELICSTGLCGIHNCSPVNAEASNKAFV